MPNKTENPCKFQRWHGATIIHEWGQWGESEYDNQQENRQCSRCGLIQHRVISRNARNTN